MLRFKFSFSNNPIYCIVPVNRHEQPKHINTNTQLSASLSTTMSVRAAATTALLALGLVASSTHAHPANYLNKHGCAVPNASTTIMGKVPQKSTDLATLECGEYKCILEMKSEGKVLVFLQENANATTTTLEADHLKCHGDDDHSGHDHGHRRLEGDCGETKCNGKVIYSKESAKEFTNLEINTKAKSVKLLVYSANKYGQVKYAELEDTDIATKMKHESNGSGPLGSPSFICWVTALAIMAWQLF